jgi:membrane protease YdiL (CAAX protease family)
MTTVEHDDSPPGWYPDPGGTAEQRYWDGGQWTDGVVVGGAVEEQPLPPQPVDRDQRAGLPPIAAAWALIGVVAGIAGATLAVLAARAVTDSLVAELAASQVVLWTGVLVPVVVASRRYGTGSLVRDHQLCWRPTDVPLGLGMSLAARIAAALAATVAVLATGLDADAFPNQLDVFRDERAALYLVFVFALAGAPIIEELFFRGLLQRSLQPAIGVTGAIAVQGLLFGAAHATAIATWQQNVVLVAMLGTVGVVAGVLVHTTKRLTPAMWMHFFFNALAVVVTASQL